MGTKGFSFGMHRAYYVPMGSIQLKTGHNTDAPIYRLEDFTQATGGFDLVHALLELQGIGAAMQNFLQKKVVLRDPMFPTMDTDRYFLITRDGNALIAKYLLEHSNELSTRRFTHQDHGHAMIVFHNLETDLNYIDTSSPDAYKFVIRTCNAQWRYWRTYAHIFGRYLFMFDLPEAERVNEMCRERLGLTFKESATIGLCMFGYMSDNRYISASGLVNHTLQSPWIRSCLTQEKVDAFVRLFSTTVPEFRRKCEEWRTQNSLLPLQKYEFNPLWSTPLIRPSLVGNVRRRLIAPSVPDLVYASCEGVYFKAMDAHQRDGRRNAFSQEFGNVFEKYGLHLLRLAEIPFQDEESNNKKLDALVPGKSRNVHIEFKKNIMSNEARACAGDALERFIERLAVDNILGQLYPKRDANSLNILVCMDELHMFEEKVKPVIEERLRRDSKYDPTFKFHLLGVSNYESIVQMTQDTGTTLEDIFAAKEQDGYYEDAQRFAQRRFNYNPQELAFIKRKYDEYLQLLHNS